MSAFIFLPKNTGLAWFAKRSCELLSIPTEGAIRVRGEDVPSWLEELGKRGKAGLGITGEDLLREFCLRERTTTLCVLKRLPWHDPCALFGKPTLCLLGPKGKTLSELKESRKRLTVCVNAKYERIAKKYLNGIEGQGLTFRKMYVNGAAEEGCAQGIADLLIEIVYTGRTIKENRLAVYDRILESDLLLLANAPARLILGGEEDGQDG